METSKKNSNSTTVDECVNVSCVMATISSTHFWNLGAIDRGHGGQEIKSKLLYFG